MAVTAVVNNTKSAAMNIEILLDGWARWLYGERESKGYMSGARTIIARMMAGLKSTTCRLCGGQGKDKVTKQKCWRCKGEGKISAKPSEFKPRSGKQCPQCPDPDPGSATYGMSLGEINNNGIKSTCPKCRGSRRVPGVYFNDAINPAFIRSTHVRYENPIYSHVDQILCADLNEQQYRVVYEEFVNADRTQAMKADRLMISRTRYCHVLTEAKQILATKLHERNIRY